MLQTLFTAIVSSNQKRPW